MRDNKKAFRIVRVPTEEEERERAMSRQRQQLVRERQRLAAMGRSLLGHARHSRHRAVVEGKHAGSRQGAGTRLGDGAP